MSKELNSKVIQTAKELIEISDKDSLKILVPFIANSTDCRELLNKLQIKASQMIKKFLSSKEIEKRINRRLDKVIDKAINFEIDRCLGDVIKSQKVQNKVKKYIVDNELIDSAIDKNKAKILRHAGYEIEHTLDYLGEDESLAEEINSMVNEKIMLEVEKLLKDDLKG